MNDEVEMSPLPEPQQPVTDLGNQQQQAINALVKQGMPLTNENLSHMLQSMGARGLVASGSAIDDAAGNSGGDAIMDFIDRNDLGVAPKQAVVGQPQGNTPVDSVASENARRAAGIPKDNWDYANSRPMQNATQMQTPPVAPVPTPGSAEENPSNVPGMLASGAAGGVIAELIRRRMAQKNGTANAGANPQSVRPRTEPAVASPSSNGKGSSGNKKSGSGNSRNAFTERSATASGNNKATSGNAKARAKPNPAVEVLSSRRSGNVSSNRSTGSGKASEKSASSKASGNKSQPNTELGRGGKSSSESAAAEKVTRETQSSVKKMNPNAPQGTMADKIANPGTRRTMPKTKQSFANAAPVNDTARLNQAMVDFLQAQSGGNTPMATDPNAMMQRILRTMAR